MCGIAGIFDLRQQREPDRELLAAMNQTQFHRGPDEGGLHTEPGVGLAHRRLSIIDLALDLTYKIIAVTIFILFACFCRSRK